MLEFTGERVVPGQVNDDLWAEHLARYAWAVSMAHSTRALEIACGSGYGAKALSQVAQSVTAIDIAHDAVQAAAQHYSAPNIRYAQASASALPFRSQSFDLITAFEVIEHLEDWPNLIQEAARVLKAGGTLLVSTPNKSYYAESRATHGPNPFHAHEFEYAEFRDALLQCFAHVRVFRQDRLEAFAFYESNGFGRADLNAASERPEDSHFYVGVCSNAPLADIPPFLYAPRAVNLLRERERHIALLEEELAKNKQWLANRNAEHVELLAQHQDQKRHLEEQNRWAEKVGAELKEARERIVTLQDDFAALEKSAAASIQRMEVELDQTHQGYRTQIEAMEVEDRAKTEHARQVEAQLQQAEATLTRTRDLLAQAEQLTEERTKWAQDLDRQIDAARAQIESIRGSRWVRLGRAVGLGPKL